MSDSLKKYLICIGDKEQLVEITHVYHVEADDYHYITLHRVGGTKFVFNKLDAVYMWVSEED